MSTESPRKFVKSPHKSVNLPGATHGKSDAAAAPQPAGRPFSPRSQGEAEPMDQDLIDSAAQAATSDDDMHENYAPQDEVLQRFLDRKFLLHTKLTMPKDVEMPPYRLLGRFCLNSPELWGHSLAALADEWCCAYLNTSGGMLVLGVDSDGTIEGVPINTHHSHVHAFLAPFFAALDQFWPSISHSLVTVALIPVHTPVAVFDPYYVIVIRVRKGPFPLYLNSKQEGYVGDHVLQKLTPEGQEKQLRTLDSQGMLRYLQALHPAKNRYHPAFGEVLKGEKPFVFHYSSHWSHPPLTLIPESATVGNASKHGVVVKQDLQDSHGHPHSHQHHSAPHQHQHQHPQAVQDFAPPDQHPERRDDAKPSNRRVPPCKHNKWKYVGSDTMSSGGHRANLVCVVCGAFWSCFSRKGCVEDVRCKYYAKGHCRDGERCKFNHIVETGDDGTPATPKGGFQGTPKQAPRTPKRRGQNPLSGLMRRPDLQPLPEAAGTHLRVDTQAPGVPPTAVHSPRAARPDVPARIVPTPPPEVDTAPPPPAVNTTVSPLAVLPEAVPVVPMEGTPGDAPAPVPVALPSPSATVAAPVVRERNLQEPPPRIVIQPQLSAAPSADCDMHESDSDHSQHEAEKAVNPPPARPHGSKPVANVTKKRKTRVTKTRVRGTPKKQL